MITDEMLVAATQEISLCMVDGIAATPHSFSAQCERRIRALTRRADHPMIYRMTRSAAAVVLAIITVFGAVLALSPQVRAAVIGWVRSTFGSYFQYSTEETSSANVQYEYVLPDKFDEYTLLTKIDKETGMVYVYVNTSGKMLQFEYLRGTDAGSLFIDTENCVHEVGYIGSCIADIYIEPNNQRNSIVVWQDTSNNLLCYLAVTADRDSLLSYAEKIENFKKIIE